MNKNTSLGVPNGHSHWSAILQKFIAWAYLCLSFANCISGLARGSAVERRSLAGELSLSCARPVADG